MITSETARPPIPPFDRDAAVKKVPLAEDAWNSRDPEKVAGAYTVDSVWRNRSEFFSGREAIIQFLKCRNIPAGQGSNHRTDQLSCGECGSSSPERSLSLLHSYNTEKVRFNPGKV